MNIPLYVVSFLTSRGMMLATAESCTAGKIASLLAEVPGSGACLDVGFVTYSPSGKAGFLGVRKETMDRYGLTSEEVAREMAEGALGLEGCSAEIAVSNTGVADSAPPGGPVPGTQCFAWSYRGRDGCIVTFSETKIFEGGRNEIRDAAALYALSRIPRYVEALPARGTTNDRTTTMDNMTDADVQRWRCKRSNATKRMPSFRWLLFSQTKC